MNCEGNNTRANNRVQEEGKKNESHNSDEANGDGDDELFKDAENILCWNYWKLSTGQPNQ